MVFVWLNIKISSSRRAKCPPRDAMRGRMCLLRRGAPGKQKRRVKGPAMCLRGTVRVRFAPVGLTAHRAESLAPQVTEVFGDTLFDVASHLEAVVPQSGQERGNMQPLPPRSRERNQRRLVPESVHKGTLGRSPVLKSPLCRDVCSIHSGRGGHGQGSHPTVGGSQTQPGHWQYMVTLVTLSTGDVGRGAGVWSTSPQGGPHGGCDRAGGAGPSSPPPSQGWVIPR
nr:uncharacterized protein LOC105870499 [Microcebus murinus]